MRYVLYLAAASYLVISVGLCTTDSVRELAREIGIAAYGLVFIGVAIALPWAVILVAALVRLLLGAGVTNEELLAYRRQRPPAAVSSLELTSDVLLSCVLLIALSGVVWFVAIAFVQAFVPSLFFGRAFRVVAGVLAGIVCIVAIPVSQRALPFVRLGARLRAPLLCRAVSYLAHVCMIATMPLLAGVPLLFLVAAGGAGEAAGEYVDAYAKHAGPGQMADPMPFVMILAMVLFALVAVGGVIYLMISLPTLLKSSTLRVARRHKVRLEGDDVAQAIIELVRQHPCELHAFLSAANASERGYVEGLRALLGPAPLPHPPEEAASG